MSATVNLKLWKYRPKKDGSFPIYIRITKNRKSSWQSTDFSVKAKDWDEAKGKVKTSHPNSARLNAQLTQVQLRYQNDVMEIENGQMHTGIKAIKQKMNGQDAKNFTLIAKELSNSYKLSGKISSYDRANVVINKLTEYMQSTDFNFQDIDVRVLQGFQNHLMERKKNQASTVNKNLKFIKTVFLYAQRMEYIPVNVNPFLQFRFIKTTSERGFLTLNEIAAIEKADCSAIPFVQKAKDTILFQYYSGGLRISDVLLLKFTNIVGDRIHLTIRKTGKQTSHKLTQKAITMIDKYRKNNTSYIFGYLPDNLDLQDLINVEAEIGAKTALINNALKRIAKIAGIGKNLTTHIFRHSFATNALHQGMPLEVLQNILKHSNIRETQIYAKVLNQKVDAEMDKLNL